MLGHRLRRWPSVGPILRQRIVFAGMFLDSHCFLVGAAVTFPPRGPRCPHGVQTLLVASPAVHATLVECSARILASFPHALSCTLPSVHL